MWIDHSLLIHWSVDRYLGCFLLIPPVSNSARSKYFFKFSLLALLGTYLEEEVVRLMVIPRLPLGESGHSVLHGGGTTAQDITVGGEGEIQRWGARASFGVAGS